MLFDHCVENINTIAIPACPGIKGRIGSLVVDPAAHANHLLNIDLPIDILLLGIDDAVNMAAVELVNQVFFETLNSRI